MMVMVLVVVDSEVLMMVILIVNVISDSNGLLMAVSVLRVMIMKKVMEMVRN